MRFLRLKRSLILKGVVFGTMGLLVFSFQNCAPGFQPFDTSTLNQQSSAPDSQGSDPSTPAGSTGYGTYLKPFAANSPWNSKPKTFTLGTATIPTDSYEAMIAAGEFSTSMYLATAADPPNTVYQVFDQESGVTRDLVIPHWPAGAESASGSDGHLDIVDETTGILHSFWVARLKDGRWTASLYAWSRLNGSGFGDPAHYYQGARAAAVPTSAGIIRKHEINDGKDQYEHALAMSLTYSGLSKENGGYVFPATSADRDYTANYGGIPEGALVMLPSTFDLSKISSPAIRKVAKTLMTYGAYVVDRNTGTPFVIYQEIGTSGIAFWQQSEDTRQIRSALRQANVTEFVDGLGRAYAPDLRQNILSMRGTYQLQSGTVHSSFDMYNQKRVWGPTTTPSREFIYTSTNVSWAKPKAGDTYTVKATTEGGAKFKLQVGDFDSGFLNNGETRTFTWPASGSMISIIESGVGPSSSAAGTVIKN